MSRNGYNSWAYYVANEYYREVKIVDSEQENDLYIYEFFDDLSWMHQCAVVFHDHIMIQDDTQGSVTDEFDTILYTLKILKGTE